MTALACPVCALAVDGVAALATHLVDAAGDSDVGHVMWLNRNITKHQAGADQLVPLLEAWLGGRATGEERVVR